MRVEDSNMALNCNAIQEPIFQPAYRIIASISQSNPATVTTTFAHGYTDDQVIRLIVPKNNGMIEVDKQEFIITVTADTTFTIPIDSTNFREFVVPINPPWFVNTCPQTIPAGEKNTLAGSYRNRLPY